MTGSTFEELLAQGVSAPVDGWDFSWFAGRASQERPSWGYSRLLEERIGAAAAAVDLQTGGGEVLAEVLERIRERSSTLAATESWPPNIELARRNLGRYGVSVVAVPDDADLPFLADSFDLVVSRHPTLTRWDEIARVLTPGGTYLSQQVGPGSERELTEAFLGVQPRSDARSARRAATSARFAGLDVVDLREASLRTVFNDIGAVVAFLRKVVWIVPGFTAESYRPQLEDLHKRILGAGCFVSHATRFLIEARKPHS